MDPEKNLSKNSLQEVFSIVLAINKFEESVNNVRRNAKTQLKQILFKHDLTVTENKYLNIDMEPDLKAEQIILEDNKKIYAFFKELKEGEGMKNQIDEALKPLLKDNLPLDFKVQENFSPAILSEAIWEFLDEQIVSLKKENVSAPWGIISSREYVEMLTNCVIRKDSQGLSVTLETLKDQIEMSQKELKDKTGVVIQNRTRRVTVEKIDKAQDIVEENKRIDEIQAKIECLENKLTEIKRIQDNMMHPDYDLEETEDLAPQENIEDLKKTLQRLQQDKENLMREILEIAPEIVIAQKNAREIAPKYFYPTQFLPYIEIYKNYENIMSSITKIAEKNEGNDLDNKTKKFIRLLQGYKKKSESEQLDFNDILRKIEYELCHDSEVLHQQMTSEKIDSEPQSLSNENIVENNKTQTDYESTHDESANVDEPDPRYSETLSWFVGCMFGSQVELKNENEDSFFRTSNPNPIRFSGCFSNCLMGEQEPSKSSSNYNDASPKTPPKSPSMQR